MLICINKFDKSESKYCCDRCKKEISSQNRKAIYVAECYSNAKKKWDLCPRCYRMLEKGIERGVKNG